jgi:predicted amidohydrolase
VRTTVVQFAADTDAEANLGRIGELVDVAGRQGAELVVLPEAAMYDFGAPDLPLGPAAQHLDGDFVGRLGKLAARHGLAIVAGMFEVSDDPGRPFNTLVVLDPDGSLRTSYRKAHLYDSFGYRESDRLRSGDPEPVVVSMGDLTLGLMTCYDLRFPEFARLLVDAGADVLVVPSAWVRGPLKEDHWETLVRARAIENTTYVVAAGQTGRTYVGCSMIVDPMGVAVARLGDNEDVATAEVAAVELTRVRERNPSLVNRRLFNVR